MTTDDLQFFNNLSGTLEIELSVPAEPMANLLNLKASPEARIVSLKLRAQVFDKITEKSRDLTPDELNSIAFRGAQIKLRSESDDVVSHKAPNGKFFTVRDLLFAVEQTERRTRNDTEWLGGVDVHHCFFEGIEENDDGIWDIYWGS